MKYPYMDVNYVILKLCSIKYQYHKLAYENLCEIMIGSEGQNSLQKAALKRRLQDGRRV